MLTWLRRVIVALGLAVLIVAVAAFLAVRASLPMIEGRVEAPRLSAPASIERDDHGIPVLRAPDRVSLAFATGFAHGQDRFFQMDLLRRRAAGELAALVGQAALPLDRRHRIHRFRSRAGAAVAELTAEQRAVIDAYADGVNAAAAGLDARPFEYLLLGSDPVPWRAEDTVLVLHSMYLELNDPRVTRDLRRGYAALALPEAYFEWLYPEGSDWDAPLAGAAPAPPSLPGPDVIDLRDLDAALAGEPDADAALDANIGSNSWAVGGALTGDGRAIVANDMHLRIDVPNIWYRARLVQTGARARDLSGVTLPGTPFVVTGSNGHIAWAFTNSYGDWSDAVVLRPGSEPGSYRTPNGDRAFDTYRETLHIAGGGSVTIDVRETVWGPVLEDVDYPGGTVAVSWIAHHPQAINLRHLDLETATSAADALAIANRLGIPPQNFVVGDADGNIGWTIAGRIPRRGPEPQDRPADWSEKGGWSGWIAAADYPRILNPEHHRIWTANSRVVGGEAGAPIGNGGYNLGARATQIRDRLFARDDWSAGDMLAIQLDDEARFLSRWRDLLLDTLDAEALETSPGRAEYRRLVEDWGGRASIDAVGYRLTRAFRMEVRARVFDVLTAPLVARFGADVPRRVSRRFEGPLWQVLSERPAHLLTRDHPDWRSLLLAAVDANIDYFATRHADGLDRRSWGERNTAAFRHPLSPAVPQLARWLDYPADPLAGDGHMPRVQRPNFGASERFAVAPGNEAGGYLHMPGGQSAHPMSGYFLKGHDDWVAGRPGRFVAGEPASRLQLVPAGAAEGN